MDRTAVSGPETRSTPIRFEADAAAAPLTRRELRARERAEAAAAGAPAPGAGEHDATALVAVEAAAPVAVESTAPASTPGAAQPAVEPTTPAPTPGAAQPVALPEGPLRMPPLVSARQHAHSAPHRSAHKGRGRARVRKSASLVAMTFVAAMAIATSVPAVALLSPADVAAQADPVSRTVAAAGDSLPSQSLTTGADVSEQAVVRDGYDVKSFQQVVALSHMRIADTFTNDPLGTIQWPFPVGVPIASYYGPRIAPTEGASTFHEGVDFDPGAGVPIQAIADGTVREVDPYNDNALGVHVIIDHMIDGQLVSSVYGHMRPGSLKVVKGQQVKVTDIIGNVGSTGISTGPHLHFEIRLNGTTNVDPFAWLKAHAN
ncbi:peptidoglycan DD-metalloendopeptidase family protein [Microbacterium sp. STN6]|uniref:M23 family metallopeptidase n=1 Tax=Microbacterium sp. STN6 TaxID=2995588 RepID=UPI002260BA8F|nr:peptidoglycan DD-metalloendopeptidase family protein [Microbacterium sp. STN6]MCX7520712.1 peptidoglycan DD-metalloendopeptidase family protein [Microbacterium sp. STN6]